ncbi:MAG: hypothetical protein AAF211_19805, partial [Myxococcota bacterium]
DHRPREARLCWTRAVWQAGPAHLPEVLKRWACAETAHCDDPTWREVARALRGHALSDRLREQAVARAHAEQLGPRARALVAPGGFTRRALLATGLAVPLRPEPVALPGSIRHAGQHVEPHQTPTLSGDLERMLPPLLERFEASCDALHIAHRTRASQAAPVERKPMSSGAREATRGYLHFLWAWAQARLSEPGLALDHVQAGLRLVDREDPVHAAVTLAFRLRVEQAMQGLPATAPLPESVRSTLNALPQTPRYRVDRLIGALGLFGPNPELVSAFYGFAGSSRADRAWARKAWPDDEVARKRTLRAMIDNETPRFAGELVFWLRSEPVEVALAGTRRLLERFAQDPRVLGEVAVSAAHFDDRDLGARALEAARRAPPEVCLAVLSSAGGHFRYLGLLEEGLQAYQRAARSPNHDLSTAVKRARAGAAFGLHVAEETVAEVVSAPRHGALEHAGQLASAMAWFAPTHARRFGAELLASAPRVHDEYSTLHHFSLRTLVFGGAIVGAFASDHLALSRTGRAHAAVDEARLRRGPRGLAETARSSHQKAEQSSKSHHP